MRKYRKSRHEQAAIDNMSLEEAILTALTARLTFNFKLLKIDSTRQDCILAPIDPWIHGLGLVGSYMERIEKLREVHEVTLTVSASYSKSWELPGGIERRTHPGLSSWHQAYRSAREFKKWLTSQEGKRLASRFTGVHWTITIKKK